MYIYIYTHTPPLPNPVNCRWTLGWFPCGGYCEESGNEHVGACVFFFRKVLSGYMPKSGTDGSYDRSMCRFLRYLCTVGCSCCASLHSQQHCRRVLSSPHPLQHLLFVDFWIMAILTGARWYLVVGWSCTSYSVACSKCFSTVLSNSKFTPAFGTQDGNWCPLKKTHGLLDRRTRSLLRGLNPYLSPHEK